MPNITWFAFTATESAGSMSIRGKCSSTAFHDGSCTFDIEVEGTGLSVKTRKSITPDEAEAFVRQVNLMREGGTTQPANLKSAVVADFVLRVEPKDECCYIIFNLRHGNPSQWSLSFELTALVSDVEADAGS